MRALRDGNCGPTSAEGAYDPHNDGEKKRIKNSYNTFVNISCTFNTTIISIIINEYDNNKIFLSV